MEPRICKDCPNNARPNGLLCNSCALMKSRYGVGIKDIYAITAKQKQCCKLCKRPRKLFIDYDHTKNIVRGLLCRSCKVSVSICNKAGVENTARELLKRIEMARNYILCHDSVQ